MKSYFDSKLKNSKEIDLKMNLVNNLKEVKEVMKDIDGEKNDIKSKNEKTNYENNQYEGNLPLLKKLFHILSSKAIKPILNIFKHFCQSSNIFITYGIEMSRQSFMNMVNYFKFPKTFNVKVNDFNILFNNFCSIKPEIKMSNSISKIGNSTSNYLTFADFLKIMISLSYLKNSKYNSKPIYQTPKGSTSNLTLEILHLNFELILSVDDCYPRHIEKTVFQLISSSLKPNNYGFIESDLETHKSCIRSIESRINEAVKLDGNLNLMLCMIEPIMYEIFTKYSTHYHNIKAIKEREENFKMISKSFIDFKRKSVNDLSSLNTNIHTTTNTNNVKNSDKINAEKIKSIELNYDKFKNKSKYFSTMTIKYFFAFCNDFNISPELLISKKDIFTLFSSFIVNMDDYYIFNNKEFSITFDNFYFLLIMIAGETPVYDSGRNTLFEKVYFLFDNLDIKGFEAKKLLNLKHKINDVLNKFKNMLVLNEKKEQLFKNINDIENMERNQDIFGM